MAEINILKSSFNGKLGNVYGASQWGGHYVKAVPFSHAPRNKTQKECFSAFGKLNRFSAGVSKVFFDYMGLSTKKMLKHNAVANFLKPAIEGHSFSIQNIEKVIPHDGTCAIDSFDVDIDTQSIVLTASTSEEVNQEEGRAWFMGVCDSSGKMLAAAVPAGRVNTLKITAPMLDNKSYFGVVFRADPVLNGAKVHGFDSTAQLIIVNHVWYTSRMPQSGAYLLAELSLKVPNGELTINDSVIKLNA